MPSSSTMHPRTLWTRISRHAFYRDHCVFLFPMLGWFVSSALLSAYNKYVFGDDGGGGMAFPCPLLLTSIHFACQWTVSHVLCATFPRCTGSARIRRLSWREFAAVSVPCGVVTAADVGLSNLSMVHLSLTFYTMIKASTPVFVLFWAWTFRLERITTSLVTVVAVIALGEFLTVCGETRFVVTGFVLCLSASVLSGARWTLVQLKLQTLDPPLATSLATMRVLAPSMFLSLFVVALIVERPWTRLRWDQAGSVLTLGAVGATFAIGMVLCEFMLIMRASAVILMIGGVVKELLNIGVGMAFFGDRLNWINTLGFTIVFGGVILYKWTFHHGGSSSSVAAADGVVPVPIGDRYGVVTTIAPSDHDEDDDDDANNDRHAKSSDDGLPSADHQHEDDDDDHDDPQERFRDEERPDNDLLQRPHPQQPQDLLQRPHPQQPQEDPYLHHRRRSEPDAVGTTMREDGSDDHVELQESMTTMGTLT